MDYPNETGVKWHVNIKMKIVERKFYCDRNNGQVYTMIKWVDENETCLKNLTECTISIS